MNDRAVVISPSGNEVIPIEEVGTTRVPKESEGVLRSLERSFWLYIESLTEAQRQAESSERLGIERGKLMERE